MTSSNDGPPGPPENVRFREQRNQHNLGIREARELLDRWDRGLEHFGLKPDPAADLAQIRRRFSEYAEWVAAGAPEREREKAQDAARYVDQVQRIGLTLEQLATIPSAREQVTWLLKGIDRLERLSEQAQDHLFELEVAAYLGRAGLSPAFAEPDVVVTLPGHIAPIGLACKRIQSRAKIVRRMKQAVAQIHKSQRPGVVLANLEPLVNDRRPGDQPASSVADADWRLSGRMDELIRSRDCSLDELWARSPWFRGVVWWGFATYDLPTQQYATQRFLQRCPTPTRWCAP